ncbi:unnamed protein product [Withania somnifera]
MYSSNIILNKDDCSSSSNISTLSTNVSMFTLQERTKEYVEEKEPETELKHIVFGVAASSNLWNKRKEYIKLWWKPGETRGVVWLDEKVKTNRNEGLPDIRISGDTSKKIYTNRQGRRSALRISRVVSETLRLGLRDVRWFVMGDDDTVFFYDHKQCYYIGSSSESHVQNIFFSYAMAFGGGGFATSYPLAKELEKMQDRCIQRYPGLYGSDDRIEACMAELGVPLTKERGFHQYDVYGNLLGLMGAHPVKPLVSLHHLDVVDPVFSGMSRVSGLQRLFDSAKLDSASLMQQSICYDKERYWSISVTWGCVVQIIRGNISPRELEMPTRTFLNWYRRADCTAYAFNTRPIIGIYYRRREPPPYCRWKVESPDKVNNIVLLKRPDSNRWKKSPRRDCCGILASNNTSKSNLSMWVGSCSLAEKVKSVSCSC